MATSIKKVAKTHLNKLSKTRVIDIKKLGVGLYKFKMQLMKVKYHSAYTMRQSPKIKKIKIKNPERHYIAETRANKIVRPTICSIKSYRERDANLPISCSGKLETSVP